MHYYKRQIGHYNNKAARLSILQHGVYNLLIDACYDRERFPTREDAIEWIWASTPEEIQAVDFVLSKFFIKNKKGEFIQDRIAEELEKYHARCEVNKTNRNKSITNGDESLIYDNEMPDSKTQLRIKNKELRIKNKELNNTADAVSDVFNYWQSMMGKQSSKLTQGRKDKIKARLKTYSLDEIKDAIDGCSQSNFHMGKNDSKKIYNSIELICRSDEKLEAFKEMKKKPKVYGEF